VSISWWFTHARSWYCGMSARGCPSQPASTCASPIRSGRQRMRTPCAKVWQAGRAELCRRRPRSGRPLLRDGESTDIRRRAERPRALRRSAPRPPRRAARACFRSPSRSRART
jgi:hypothetical protein